MADKFAEEYLFPECLLLIVELSGFASITPAKDMAGAVRTKNKLDKLHEVRSVHILRWHPKEAVWV